MVEVKSGFITEVRFNNGRWFQVPRGWTTKWSEDHRREQLVDQSTIEIHEISVAVREATEVVREARDATRSHELAMIQAVSHLIEAIRELTQAVRDLPGELPLD